MKDQFWKEKIAELQDVEVRNLTVCGANAKQAFQGGGSSCARGVHAPEDTSTAGASTSQ